MTVTFEYTLITALSTAILGAGAQWLYHRIKYQGLENLGQSIIQRAEMDANLKLQKTDLELKQKEIEFERKLDETSKKERQKLQEFEKRLADREEKLERRMNLVEKKLSDSEKRESILIARRNQLEDERRSVEERQIQLKSELEQMSKLSSQEAKELLLMKIENEVRKDAANLTRKIQKETEEDCERLASTLLATAINRLALPCVSELTVTTVAISSDEMKGRIIGREGRNIRTLERATGVNFLVDDTPGVIVISGFDPIRKQIAKVALQELIADGRIHPTRIEEIVEKSQQTVHKQIKKHGEEAALRAGVYNLHPELIQLLGKLKFRYSFGQNVLDHSLEVSHLMGLMAAELGLDKTLAKRIGLLHDIGKALTHEYEGTHALLGRDFSLKYGETEAVANGIGCHHNEIAPITPEGALCEIADRLSATRPGARVEAIEEYMKRLKKLEEICFGFPGIEKAYAMQAGREVRVVVLPDMIDDQGLINLSRDISRRIEKEVSYAGKIKVTLIREKRVVEYAL